MIQTEIISECDMWYKLKSNRLGIPFLVFILLFISENAVSIVTDDTASSWFSIYITFYSLSNCILLPFFVEWFNGPIGEEIISLGVWLCSLQSPNVPSSLWLLYFYCIVNQILWVVYRDLSYNKFSISQVNQICHEDRV